LASYYFSDVPNKPKRTAPRRTPKAPAREPEKRPNAKSRKAVVEEIRKKVEDKLSHDVEKASLGDYIRLVAFEKELEESEPREITVTWIDPPEK
jgi:hypothetical protein